MSKPSTTTGRLVETQLFEAQEFRLLVSHSPFIENTTDYAKLLQQLSTVPFSQNSSTAFDLLSYIATNSDGELSYGVALILYIGSSNTPAVSWEMLSYVNNQPSAIAGAERLLEALESGMGGAIGEPAHFNLVKLS